MVEPLACAVHGLRRLGPVFGDTVVLTGAGTMGLLLLQLLVHAGAGPVTVVDRVSDRLEVARKLGAARVVGDVGELAGERFEIAVDASGVAGAGRRRRRGCSTGAGGCSSSASPRPRRRSASRRSASTTTRSPITGSMAILRSFAPAVELIASGVVDPRPLLSEPLPLDGVRRGAAAGAGRPGDQMAHPPVITAGQPAEGALGLGESGRRHVHRAHRLSVEGDVVVDVQPPAPDGQVR